MNKLQLKDRYTRDEKLQVGNGKHLHITHFGSSSLSSLHLPKVFVVPRLTKNLLSVSQLAQDNNVFMDCWPNHCVVKILQDTLILKGHVDHGFYRLEPPSLQPVSPMDLSCVRTSMTVWHNRLAHPHEAIL